MPKRKSSKKKKFRILLDSAFAKSDCFPRLKKKANVAHTVHDLKLSPQAEDNEIYQTAVREERFVLTINFKDFRKLVKANRPGIISIESQLSNEQIDKIVSDFISNKNPKDYIGKAVHIK